MEVEYLVLGLNRNCFHHPSVTGREGNLAPSYSLNFESFIRCDTRDVTMKTIRRKMDNIQHCNKIQVSIVQCELWNNRCINNMYIGVE